MKASSESGLWALTISVGATDVIGAKATLSVHHDSGYSVGKRELDKRGITVQIEGGRLWLASWNIRWRSSFCALSADAFPMAYDESDRSEFRVACSLTTGDYRPLAGPVLYVTSRRSGVGL